MNPGLGRARTEPADPAGEALGTLYPHLVTCQKPVTWYAHFVVGRERAVDRVQTFDPGASDNFECLFSLRPE